MAKKKFIIVSNRLPINVSKVDGKLVFSASSGGLATALSRLNKDMSDRIWIGWPGICEEDTTAAERRKITKKLKADGCLPIFLTKKQVERYYDGYSNDTIWPLFHYFQSYIKNDSRYWDDYKEVNKLFAQVVGDLAGSSSVIWVHDYHLMLLPRLLRQKLPGAKIGFFLHVPFPSYEVFRLLPNRSELLKGLLGADLIGFHVYDYVRHFLFSVRRTVGLESSVGTVAVDRRIVKVDAFPIGIDYAKFAGAAKDKKVQKELNAMKNSYRGKKVILSMDRLDYTKGILNRLVAFDQFLKKYPQFQQKVVLVMVAVPSRTQVPTYKNLKSEIEEMISRINGKYSTVNWTPIVYQFKNLPYEQVAALLLRADIALLTPLRDGMNLVAKEYVAVKQNKLGVLVLSEMTGAIDELPEAIRVNPYDLIDIREAIKDAFEVPASIQKAKLRSMQKRLSRYTVGRWAEDFIEQLDSADKEPAAYGAKLLDKTKQRQVLESFKKAKKRLILLDYDGTVTDLVTNYRAEQSKPSAELIELLKNIAGMKDTALALLSGRPKNVLEKWFGDIPMALCAEHGAWLKTDGGWSRAQVSFSKLRPRVKKLLWHYAERTPGADIEDKDLGLVWHYRNVPAELAQARNASIEYELKNMLSGSGFAVFRGSKVLEVKPTNVNKGSAVQELIAMDDPDFILCIGDDNTDEDMFQALPEDAFSIKVGMGETFANFQVQQVSDVIKLLYKLADA